MNYVENLPYVIFLPPIAGIFFPIPALTGVYCIWLSRIMYAIGYRSPKAGMLRAGGFLMGFCNTLMLLICAFWTAIKVMEVGADLAELEVETMLDPLDDLIKGKDDRLRF